MRATKSFRLLVLIAMLVVASLTFAATPAQAVELLVSSCNTDNVKRYNGTTGAFIDSFASGGGLDAPIGLVFGPDGHLYVSSRTTDNVKRYNGTTGVFIDTFASGGGLDGPSFLTFTPAPVPEPGTLALLLGGLAAVAAALRRRKR